MKDLRDVTWIAKKTEEIGLDYFLVSDYAWGVDPYLCLAQIAVTTKRVVIGPAVTNPYLNHPVITSRSLCSLYELAPERVICGIGAGDRGALEALGIVRVKPLERVEESVALIREVVSRRIVSFSGSTFKVRNARHFFNIPMRIPVFVGGQGPRMLELGARIGDGVLINLSDPKDYKGALEAIGRGNKKRGSKNGELQIITCAPFSIAKTRDEAYKAVVAAVSVIVAGARQTLLENHGISIEQRNMMVRMLRKGNVTEASKKVTREMIEGFSISGTPNSILERIEKLRAYGITAILACSPLGSSFSGSIGLIARQIMPYLKD